MYIDINFLALVDHTNHSDYIMDVEEEVKIFFMFFPPSYTLLPLIACMNAAIFLMICPCVWLVSLIFLHFVSSDCLLTDKMCIWCKLLSCLVCTYLEPVCEYVKWLAGLSFRYQVCVHPWGWSHWSWLLLQSWIYFFVFQKFCMYTGSDVVVN